MREFSILKGRILQYLELKGITKYTFYKVTGIANGVLSQPNGISEDNLLRFLECYPEVNPSWLLRGEGAMLQAGESKVPSVDYASGHPMLQGVACDVDAYYGASPVPSSGAAGVSVGNRHVVANVHVPVRSLQRAFDLHAGVARAYAYIGLPEPFLAGSGAWVCFRVEGQEMHPTLQEGDYVVCRLLARDSWNEQREESICVIALGRKPGREVLMRRLRWEGDGETVLAIPDHPDRCTYPAARLAVADIRAIWKVEWTLHATRS